MDLETIERQRVKQYRLLLKREMEIRNNQRQKQKNYSNQKSQKQMNQLMSKLKEDQRQSYIDRRNYAKLLQQQNAEIISLNKSKVSITQPNNESFQDTLRNIDARRNNRLKEQIRSQAQSNYKQYQIRKQSNQKNKQLEKIKQKQHNDYLLSMNDRSKRDYRAIIQKHAQDMNMYKQHEDMMNQNLKHRQNIQKFTNTNQDVLGDLWKKNAQKHNNAQRYNQQTLKKQITQFNQRKSVQKSHILAGHELQKSMLGSLLHDDSYDKKRYSQILKIQMREQNDKKRKQEKAIKEKYVINGIYGGQHGEERKKQIQIIDKRLGIVSPRQNQYDNYNSSPLAGQATRNNNVNDKPRQIEDRGYGERVQLNNPQKNVNSVGQAPPKNSPKLYKYFDVVGNYNKYYGASVL